MTAEIDFNSTTENKKSRYEEFTRKLEALIYNEHDEVSVMANVSSALKETFGFLGRILHSKRRHPLARSVSRQRGMLPHKERQRSMRNGVGKERDDCGAGRRKISRTHRMQPTVKIRNCSAAAKTR